MLRTFVANWLNKKSRAVPSRHSAVSRRSYRLRLECLEDRTVPATLTVTGVGDAIAVDGLVTLREALASANSNSNVNADVVGVGAYGTDTINFNIPGAGVHTITALTDLPTITDAVIIDGYSQPGASANTNGPGLGSNAVLRIQLLSSTARVNSAGVRISGGNSTVQGLIINGFWSGIDLQTNGGNQIRGNFLSTTPDGLDRGTTSGVREAILLQSSNNTIGGTDPAHRNVISNIGTGIHVPTNPVAEASNNVIQGNFIGVDATGTDAHRQGGEGILIESGSGTQIGGTEPGAGNLIHGLKGIFIILGGPREDPFIRNSNGGHTIQGNLIGTDVTGSALLSYLNSGNQPAQGIEQDGIFIVGGITHFDPLVNPLPITIGGTSAGAANVIGGSAQGAGINLSYPSEFVAATTIQGSFIGADRTGLLQFGNRFGGINLNNNVRNATITGNTIAFNSPSFNSAVTTPGGETGNRIVDNSIHDNGGGNPGIIRLTNLGPAIPTLTSVSVAGSTTTVQGTVSGTAGSVVRIDLYANAAPPSPITVQGQTPVSNLMVTIGAGGTATFTASFPTVPSQPLITATLTSPGNTTTPFSAPATVSTSVADLQLTVSDGVSSTSPGSTLTYTLNYSNTGTQVATGVQLTETRPVGTTFNAAASTAGWTETAPGSGIYRLTVGNLAVGSGSAVFVVTVNNPVPQGQSQIVNTASIADDGANGTDATPANNTSTDTDSLTALSTDVSISNVVSSATTSAGNTLTFTLDVRNLGNNPAASVSLTDAIPAGTTFVSFTAPAGWAKTVPAVGGTGTVTATRSSLAAGATGTFQLVVRVNTGAVAGTIITNLAQVTTATTDNNPNNDSASATSEVVLQTSTRLTFTLTNRIAQYRSELGLFLVDDADGLIGTLRPGDRGYAQAALLRRQFYFSRLAALGTSFTLDLPAGTFYGWYLVQNSTSARFLTGNPSNKLGKGPVMFFSFKTGNPDATEHTRQLGANLIGFEDRTKGGDKDYNDLVVKITSDEAPSLSSRAQSKSAKSR